MAKYHLYWRLDEARVPVDANERGGAWGLMMALMKQDKENGVVKDWGAFTSEGQGYCIVEGTNVEIMKMTEQYVPYILFEVKPVSTTEEVNELIQHLSG
jgi:Domain of unknown function (DUF3303)